MFIIAVTLAPALDALRIGVQGSGIHQQTAQLQYALLRRMEILEGEAFGNLLAAAAQAGNATTPSSYSDPAGQANRLIVYVALYNAGSSTPFTVPDPNTDGDNNVYTGDTARLLWLNVQLANSPYAMESLMSR